MRADEADWPTYLQKAMRAAGYDRASQLAKAANIKHPLISRWLDGSSLPDIATLRKLAPALDQTVVDLLVASGQLTPKEAGMKRAPKPPPAAEVDPTRLSDDELLDEVRRRFDRHKRRT